MADEITNAAGLPNQDITVGGGYGYLPYVNDRDRILASLYLGQGGLGQNLLQTLTQLRMSPQSGPAGLAATSAYGNSQGVAQGTDSLANQWTKAWNAYHPDQQRPLPEAEGSTGLKNVYADDFDRLLKGLMSGIMTKGSVFNPDNNGQINTDSATFQDPNKAPAPTPEAAKAAPNGVEQFFQNWPTYSADDQAKLKAIADPKGSDELLKNWGGLPGFEGGGVQPTTTPTPSAPGPTASPAPTPAPDPNGGDASVTFPGEAEPPDPLDAYGGKELVNALHSWIKQGKDPDSFIRTMQDIAALNQKIQAGEIPVAMPSAPVPGQPVNIPQLTSFSTDYILSLLRGNRSLLPNEDNVNFAGGGGVTIGGEPHFIVDSAGNKVAALTEDGKPEQVNGIGGVEVTPMDPTRRAAYERRKQFGSVIAEAEAALQAAGAGAGGSIPGAATGAQMLFPNIPGSPVNTSPTGSNELPTTAGPSTPRDQQVGDYFKSTYDPKTGQFSLPNGGSDNEKYAKLLGGALSNSNTAVSVDALHSLNAGKAPMQLLSASELATMSPSQKQGYLALLQQMGLGSAEDNASTIARFTPTALG